jgi:hypothetical protein
MNLGERAPLVNPRLELGRVPSYRALLVDVLDEAEFRARLVHPDT